MSSESKIQCNLAVGDNTETSKSWRNFWFVTKDHQTSTGVKHLAGSTVAGIRLYPTKEAAEIGAQGWLAKWAYQGHSEYIGAFPEEPTDAR